MKTDKESLFRYFLIVITFLLGIVAFLLFFREFLPEAWTVIRYVFMLLGPFLVAWLICVVSRPLQNFLRNRLHFSNNLTALVVVLIALLITTGLIMVMIGLLAAALGAVGPYVSDLATHLGNAGDEINDFFFMVDLNTLPFDKLFQQWEDMITTISGQSLGKLLGLAQGMPGALIWLIITFVATYYWCANEIRVRNGLSLLFPKRFRHSIRDSYDQISDVMGAYIRAQVELMAIDAVICLIGFLIMGIKMPIACAVIAGICGVVPLIGPVIIVGPLAIWGLLMQDISMVVGMLVVMLAFIVVRNVLQPKIVGDKVGLHPLLALASIFIGMKVFGAVGLILGPVVASLVVAIVKNARQKRIQSDSPVLEADLSGEKNK